MTTMREFVHAVLYIAYGFVCIFLPMAVIFFVLGLLN